MQEHHIKIEKQARYFSIGEPGKEIREIWYVFHGYGQLAKYFIRHFQAIAADDRLIVAPEGLSRFYLNGFAGRVGATWMTKEDRLNEIDDYIGYLNTLHQHITKEVNPEAVKISVLGFSQGTATACRWVMRGNASIHHLILWAGMMPPEIDFDNDGRIFREIPLSLILGTEDPFANKEIIAKQEALLRSQQIDFKSISFKGPHSLDAETLMALASQNK